MKKNINSEYDFLLKAIVIGSSGVGKSSILNKYVHSGFSTSFISTIGVDLKCKRVVIEGKHVKLEIWDTAGQERFKSIVASYYKNVNLNNFSI